MFLPLILCMLVVKNLALTDEEIQNEWLKFQLKHGKIRRSGLDNAQRFNIFKANLEEIEKHNKLYEQGVVSYKKGVTRFADMTEAEFLSYVGSTNYNDKANSIALTDSYSCFDKVPKAVDWRDSGAVTPVKNQKDCGSCYSFGVVAAIEGRYKIKTGKLISLSEQNIVDCSYWYGNRGCNGGNFPSSYNYVKSRGLTTEDTYPYKSKQEACTVQKKDIVVKIKRYFRVPQNEAKLKAAVAKGPVSVAISVSNNFGLYVDGVFEDQTCSQKLLNHAVAIVGYGKENGKDYWLVKNSWGDAWGLHGYIKISAGKNTCGIAAAASYPVM